MSASFEVWGFQTRAEDFIQRCIRDVLLLGHRQAFVWIDDWIDMSMDDVREYEKYSHEETNKKIAMKKSGSAYSVRSNELKSQEESSAVQIDNNQSINDERPSSERDVQLIEANK